MTYTVAYVTKTDGTEDRHIVTSRDGVTVGQTGCLILCYDKSMETGMMSEGHIIAAGQWREVNIQLEEE